MFIEKIGGTDDRLYQIVAPLVMDPDVLKQNNNYPFPTSESFVWYIAYDSDENRVKGFVPLEIRGKKAIINNYYIVGENTKVLHKILQKIVRECGKMYKLQSVTRIDDVAVFFKNGFSTVRTWKLYVKMEIQN